MYNYLNIKNDTLNTEQRVAYNMMLSGKSMFLTGPGGTGKTFLIDKYFTKATQIYGYSRVAKTSTTGISALNINGRTIHSWAGIGLGTEDVDTIIRTMLPTTKERWAKVKVLIIDEISMLNPDILDKLYEIGQRMNKPQDSYGIQYVFVGDAFQLPVVKSDYQFFDAKCWKTIVGSRTVCLKTSIRQSDTSFRNMLNKIRVGICTSDIENILLSRINAELNNEYGIKPTILYPKNKSVQVLNEQELKKLKNQGAISKIFTATYTSKTFSDKVPIAKLIDDFRKNSTVDDTIELSVGAQVLFKKNIKELDVVNGTRGVVTEFNALGMPVVTILNGTKIEVPYEKFTSARKGEFEIVKTQIPLKLAWACSIHSSQGLTLDYVLADIGDNIFDYGQTYVVLSRVRTIEGLSLISFKKENILVNPKALRLYYPEISALKEIQHGPKTDYIGLFCDNIIGKIFEFID